MFATRLAFNTLTDRWFSGPFSSQPCRTGLIPTLLLVCPPPHYTGPPYRAISGSWQNKVFRILLKKMGKQKVTMKILYSETGLLTKRRQTFSYCYTKKFINLFLLLFTLAGKRYTFCLKTGTFYIRWKKSFVRLRLSDCQIKRAYSFQIAKQKKPNIIFVTQTNLPIPSSSCFRLPSQ